jgi:hypothetical protein
LWLVAYNINTHASTVMQESHLLLCCRWYLLHFLLPRIPATTLLKALCQLLLAGLTSGCSTLAHPLPLDSPPCCVPPTVQSVSTQTAALPPAAAQPGPCAASG